MDYVSRSKQIYIGKINTSETEIRDILKAWVAISIAFALVLRHGIAATLYEVFIISALTVGIGFLLHELGHKFVAQRYGCFAEFRSFDQMLLLALLMSFFGFIIAAPGAVMIAGPVGTRRNGIISAAGPVINLALAAVFFMLSFMVSGTFVSLLFTYGFVINTWLALFNMIPVWNLDGAKVWRWNKKVFGSIVAVALLFMFLQPIVM